MKINKIFDLNIFAISLLWAIVLTFIAIVIPHILFGWTNTAKWSMNAQYCFSIGIMTFYFYAMKIIEKIF